jgi:predicted ATPase
VRITKISLTNFRSFKSTQSIELAPVTLLFGPNSVGKSSVLMALAYVQQILKKGHCNPEKLDALGSKAIGGFRSLVHGQDLNRPIKIRLDFESGGSPFVYYGAGVDEMSNHISASYPLMTDFGGSIQAGTVEFEIVWSDRHQFALVKNYRVWINGGYIGCISSSLDQRNTVINELNTQHPLLIPYNNDEWLEYTYGAPDEREPLGNDEIHTEFEQVLTGLNPNPANTAAVADIESAGEIFINRIAPVAVRCHSGAIPHLSRPVNTNLSGQDFDEPDEHFKFLVVQQVLSQAFVLPLDKLLEYLENSVLIGPLRVVPDNNYTPNPHPEQSDWVDGSAAWDLLYRDPSKNEKAKRLIDTTSEWFSAEDKLNAGYQIINQSLADTLSPGYVPTKEQQNLVNKRHLYFKELRTDILLSANQLGTGISQVLPIVVAANSDDLGLVSVEQPELHIHPRFQVELADVFLQAMQKHSFLIETHSEHLILRLLKRVRQTTDEELPDGIAATKNTDVSIVYLEPSAEGVIAKRIHLDDDGEFVEHWPHGFFAERREELL